MYVPYNVLCTKDITREINFSATNVIHCITTSPSGQETSSTPTTASHASATVMPRAASTTLHWTRSPTSMTEVVEESV